MHELILRRTRTDAWPGPLPAAPPRDMPFPHDHRLWLPLLAALLWFAPAASAVTIDWVPVGNPGNGADTTGQGAVAYPCAFPGTAANTANCAFNPPESLERLSGAAARGRMSATSYVANRLASAA